MPNESYAVKTAKKKKSVDKVIGEKQAKDYAIKEKNQVKNIKRKKEQLYLAMGSEARKKAMKSIRQEEEKLKKMRELEEARFRFMADTKRTIRDNK